MKCFFRIILITIICIGFNTASFSKNNGSDGEELKSALDGLLDWANNYLMPRSKKDREHSNIDDDTRDMVKKIRANSDWLRNHMMAQVLDGWSLDKIRDDYEQEQHYREICELTTEAMDRTDNSDGDKMYELLERFYDRFVLPIGEIVGYREGGSRHGGRHHGGRGRDRDEE